MSDFSGHEQSFGLSGIGPVELHTPPAHSALARIRERSYDVVLDEVEFQRLRGADELQSIQKMRAEIQLPGTALADPGFISREKKETGRASSVLSNGTATSSGR